MRVLMFGWEFPPLSSGGLGTACFGLTKAMVNKDIGLTFVLPYAQGIGDSHVKIVSAGDKRIKIRHISSALTPYMTSEEYAETIKKIPRKSANIYGKDLFHEVYLYSERAKQVAEEEEFDIIHAHDWMTYHAGMKAKTVSGKPLVVHVHATEFDRTGGNPNQHVYDIEREGMHQADHIIAVSNFTKDKVVEHYGINPEKVTVVHNAVEFTNYCGQDSRISKDDKVVLFLGRLTLQKGPDYFVYAARKVLDVMPDVKFVVAGNGDMERFIIEKAAELGISKNVLFTGFLTGQDIDKAYRMADLYVMPSVSEPFGITPLEALRNNVPVMISKQSGVSEVLTHALKVDFWDVDEMANKIVSTLKYGALSETLRHNGSSEVRKFSWSEPAKKCIDVYSKVLDGLKGVFKW